MDYPNRLQEAGSYELCFRSLYAPGRSVVFPCDAAGQVDIDTLSTRLRQNYFYARTVIGCEFSMPAVRPCPAALAEMHGSDRASDGTACSR